MGDLRERWTPLFEKYQVSAVFSGHDHVYERADHNGIHYFVSGGGGAPLYPRRPKSNPIDIEAVKKFERVLHYLRVNVSGNHLEVSAIRTDGTIIETQSWTDGPPIVAAITVPAAGAPVTPAPATMSQAAPAAPSSGGSIPWWAIGGGVVTLGAAVMVVRSLRS